MLIVEAANTDQTLPILQDLLASGYTIVTWLSSGRGRARSREDCGCNRLNRRRWPLKNFISGLSHDAPIFEKSHVNCKCQISVTGPKKEKIILDWRGVI